MTLLFRNSLLYGGAQLSRNSFFILVAIWFGFSREADKFFLAYGIATFIAVAVSSTFSRVLVSRLTKLSWWDVLLWPFLLGLTFIIFSTLSPFALLPMFTFYIVYSSASGILAGRLANEGKFYGPPLGVLVGGLVFLFFAVKADHTVESIVVAMTIGETSRLLIVGFFCRRLGILTFSRPAFSLFRSSVLLIIATAALGSTQLIARSFSWFLGEGAIAIFSYAYGGATIFITLLTSGLMVTRGFEWKEGKPLQLTVEGSLLFKSLLLVVLVQTVAFFLRYEINTELMRSIVILAALLPLSIITTSLVTALVASDRFSRLLLSSLTYVLVLILFVFLSNSVVGIAWSVLLSQIFLVAVLFLGTKDLLHARISNRPR